MSENQFVALFNDIVEICKTHDKLKVKSEKDLMVLFPTDRMQYGLGTDILVEIDLPMYDHERQLWVVLQRQILQVIAGMLPDALIYQHPI